jgi:L,D-transpeptidase ErfK/SrfK
MIRHIENVFLAVFIFVFSTVLHAAAYLAPPANQSLIGTVQYATAGATDTVVTVAKRYDIGFNAMENANPQLDMSKGFPAGSSLLLATAHLLPDVSRSGIIINLPEMRMYYFPQGSNQVFTYPIGIGKIGKTIPIAKTSVVRKVVNPTWVPTKNIRDFNLEQGIVLPKVMPPGPDNPLGPYAIYMRIPTYLIHSTIFPESVGKRASFGCIRMYESDIQDFFPSVTKNIPVVIVNSPIKVDWQNDRLYAEAHPPLEEHEDSYDSSLPGVVHQINNKAKDRPAIIDWQIVSYMAQEQDGIPHEVGMVIR